MQPFSSGYVRKISFIISLFLVPAIALPVLAAKKTTDAISFGRTEIVKVLPSEVEAVGWENAFSALLQDLGDSDLYQDFTRQNAAYIPTKENPLYIAPEPISEPLPVVDSYSPEENETTLEQIEDEISDDINLEFNPDEQSTDQSSPQSPDIEVETISLLGDFLFSNRLYPLAQAIIEEPLVDSSQDELNISANPEPAFVEESIPETEPIIEQALEEEVEELEQNITPNSEVETVDTDEVVIEEASSTVAVLSEEKNYGYDLQFAGFETAALEPGQFITGMQLRVSLGARPERLDENTPLPELELWYGTSTDDMTFVNSVLITEELSNAVNGGYYLFALPAPEHIDALADAKVSLRFAGDTENLEGVFIDALWLELDTRIVTRADLEERGKADKLLHLQKPGITALVSDELNFTRRDKPVFNLRYNSQRNFLVRGVRNLLGRSLVEVSEVAVTHAGEGFVGIKPVITTTKDGLITVEFTDKDKENMRPGSYEVKLTLTEGGEIFTDSFNFEWGILTINPDKTEYELGEMAEMSIGALTPNGHTVCEANLNLYLITPAEQVEKIPVRESGVCDGNNVIDVPDFSAFATTTMVGTYEMYLERMDDETGEAVIGYTTDTFEVVANQNLSIRRVGPTRIYPPSPYPMSLTVSAEESFTGTLIERVPRTFAVSETDAEITEEGDEKILTWNISLLAGRSKTVSYQFDAPDISPYLFNLGPASLDPKSSRQINNNNLATTSASSSTVLEAVSETRNAAFVEHRQWQIASDAVGKMLLFWDNNTAIPAGWVCVSCTGGDPFFQRFVVGSSTYNVTGGTANHTHTASGSVLATADATTEASGSGNISIVSHTHTYTPVISTVSNLPAYTQLRVIRYDAAAGEPATIPVGAIGMFDTASSSLPANWFRYAAVDGRYPYGENTAGTTGGSNTHTHTITGNTGAAAGGSYTSRGPDAANGATPTHTHSVSASTASDNNEPPYIDVLFAKLTATSSPPNGLIAMWDEDVDNNWLDVSSGGGDPFNNRFPRGATSYGATGGNSTHTPANVTGITSSPPSATVATARAGVGGASDVHTHTVNVTGFSTANHLPPYISVVFGKRQGTNPVYEQLSYRWYVNRTDNLTPNDPWSSVSGINLVEREPITSTSTPVKNGQEVRLRVNTAVTNATATVGSSLKLQYVAANTCSAASGWVDVGGAASSTVWRGFDNGSLSDGATVPSTLLASSTVAESYEEDGVASSTPNQIPVGGVGEWDFVLEHNGAAAGTNYCFRMVENDGTVFNAYTYYPQLYTNEAPATTTPLTLFDNEKTVSTLPDFTFITTDTEGDKVHYAIEVDNDSDFSSPVLSRDSISNSTEFENQVLISDKAPFRQGETIQFSPSSALTNGVTYYWRVRAIDPEGSNQWGTWSSTRSFTVDTTLLATAWFQTQDAQFTTNALTGVESVSNSVSLISGSTTGTMISTEIDFNDGTLGTAWDSFVFNDTETSGSISYQIQYQDDDENWTLIPDGDLSGNSSGFGTSPVSLLDLDTDTYTRLRIVATFTNSGGSPSLQDWTINWGYRVEIPTISKPFANEQVGTTTPTFEFTTSDPQDDDLTYQVEWSLTPDFAVSTTSTSDTDLGFVNSDVGSDIDPFFSGDTIQFTIQSGDALAGTTTYWWRVRAKDTTGANAYSFWTEPRSLTVILGTEQSTWFQTTQEQFNSNILSGTVAISGGAVTVATSASEAILVYGEGSVTTPRYRQWDGSTWGSEGSLLDIGAPLKWAVVRAGTTREEYVAATVGTDADVIAQVFSTGAWGNLQEMTISMGSVNARGFDVAYETISGDAIVAYCDGGPDPSYRIWNGSSWSLEGTINVASASNCEWLRLASDPTSDEIIVMVRDAAGAAYEAQVWDGTSTWANATTFGSITEAAHEGMAIAYEESGNQAIAVSSDGNPARFRWRTWDGTTWSAASTQTIGDDFEWGTLVADIGSDEITLCYQDEDTNIGTAHWSGSAWTHNNAVDEHLTTTGKAKNDPGFSCVFEDVSGRNNFEFVTYTDTTQTNYRAWNNSTWTTASQVNTIGDSITMQLIRTGTANVLGLFFDETNDSLRFANWSGSAWSSTQTLETNMSVDTAPYGKPYFMAPRNPGSAGTTIVTPAIDFTEGAGPYWKEFSFNDTTPGTSEIRYYLQYQVAPDVWAFIPNADLSGNESGTTTGPIDLSGLNTGTYQIIRPYAELSCDGSGNCPSITDWKVEWAGGIAISGIAKQYDQVASTTSGTVAVAVNGVLQTGKTALISNGLWSISNVTAFAGDVITVFITGAADSSEAVAVAMYDGAGDLDGFELYERHLSLGANTATTTPLTNALIGQYDVVNTEDVFFDLTGNTLTVCATTGCSDAELFIKAGTYYTPSGRILGHDFENNGNFTAGAFSHDFSGSWDNNATTTMMGSTIVFSATSTTENINSTGASLASFNNVTLGTTTGTATWNLSSSLDVDGNLTVNYGTISRAAIPITIGGNLTTSANGFWSGIASTTFDGGTAAAWGDQNSTLQNVGYVTIDGVSKIVSLSGPVAAESITIGNNDTLDSSISNYPITVYGDWTNQNNFVARSGLVTFAGTSGGNIIQSGGDAFYNLTFNGGGGSWAFLGSGEQINNDLVISAGIVTLATTTTTIGGSFDSTGGQFAHNNGTLLFTSNTAENITLDGAAFTNVLHSVIFNGGGSWTMQDINATTTNDISVLQGTVLFPSGTLAIGGSLADTGGAFSPNNGTVSFYGSAVETVTMGGSEFASVSFDGVGSWSFTDADAVVLADVSVNNGSLTTPSGTFSIGGSYDNNATVVASAGTVLFNASTTGETIDFGGSSLYNVTFNNTAGGFTILGNATTTNNFILQNANNWTLQSGATLAVGGSFENHVGGAATTWTGTTLELNGGTFAVNDKLESGDSYESVVVSNTTNVFWWNSVASSYSVTGGFLYSQDHNSIDGDLYIFGSYNRTAGSEYWTYDRDFDGTDITGSERAASIRFAADASATFTDVPTYIEGDVSASTTIANQGSGTYTVTISGGTTTASYYEFADLGGAGLSLTDSAIVSSFDNGSFTVAAPGGTALTVSSTTITANPAKQIFNVSFATTTAIAATNVTQTGGDPGTFWWFRDGSGNLYGESFDNDTGDPGSVRFDDSSLVLTISGTVFADAGVTPITGATSTCDGSTQVVRVVVDGGTSYTGSCSDTDGSYSVGGVVVIGDPTLTIYLDNASGGQRAAIITRTPTADITDADLYTNRVILRHEDTQALTIENIAVYDQTNDTDLAYNAATSTLPTLSVLSGNELFVWASSTFTPNGEVSLLSNGESNSYDGTLYLAANATFNAYATTTLTIGGRLVLAASSTLNVASTTVDMAATTSGKSITAFDPIIFNDLQFTGVGGTWNLGADVTVLGDMTIATGTVTGTGDITIPAGNLIGNGVLSLGGGTTTLASTNTLGGTTSWTFYNLRLGDGLTVGTTTPLFTTTTTIANRLTIENAHYLDAGNTSWDLSGTGIVFVENGTFLEDTSTIRYSGAGANVLTTTYYNLYIDSGAGSQTYIADGFGIQVDNDLIIGGAAPSTFDINTNDPLLDVNGSLIILANGTLSASDSNELQIAGNYDNNGILVSNSGTVRFDGGVSQTVAAGGSPFAAVIIDGTGSLTVTEHATATDWSLLQSGGFTLSSGQTLAVGGVFTNAISGTNTTWTGSTLSLYGGGNYSINTATTSDSYATLAIIGTTQIRMWNSEASTYSVDATASLYSQDHADIAGDLYIYGDYLNNTYADFWSYATDFDGSALGGGARKVDVYLAAGASATYAGGSLSMIGTPAASTTIQVQSSGTYNLVFGTGASTTMNYYEVRDIGSAGVVFTGTPSVADISYGDLEVSQNGGTAITVAGTAITANPAKTFTANRFALNGVASGFNVTATGTSVSSWRFTNHVGDIDGEANDVDPDGDPGYIVWDDSAAQITIAGTLYLDDGVTPAGGGICGTGLDTIQIQVAGLTSYQGECNPVDGTYSIGGISYSPGDSLVVYVDSGITTDKASVVTVDPVSNINNMDVYLNRVIVRHEGANPITIDDMAVYDNSDNSDVLFTAVNGTPDTLTIPSDHELIVWNSKTFAPGGTVTLSSGGSQSFGGRLSLYTSAVWTGSGNELLSVGGSILSDTGAVFTAAPTGTTTFATTGAGRTIDINDGAFANVAFTGSGSWTIIDTVFNAAGNVIKSAGTLTLPPATSTISGSFIQSGGSFVYNGGEFVFDGAGTHVVTLNGSQSGAITFAGGTYTITDTNATSTGRVYLESGSVTLPSGSLAVGGDFINNGATIIHNTNDLILTSTSTAALQASSSDLYAVRFVGGGAYTMLDDDITFLDDVTISSGSLTVASGTVAIGGSFDATGGSFVYAATSSATTTILFNSTDIGETINPGSSSFRNVQISAPTGGYTIVANATTTENFVLASVSDFTLQTGTTLYVGGVFNNTVTGTTNWSGSTLVLDGANAYTINTKVSGASAYDSLTIGADSDIRMWNSSATATVVSVSGSLYSQDHAASNGSLYIYGDFHIGTTTEYWSYATDFDGTSLSGSERVVTVSHASNATTTIDGGVLSMIGASGNETIVTNQGSGTYAMNLSGGTLNAQYYQMRNLGINGLNISGTPLVTSLSHGDFELAVDGGSLITITSQALNANASLVITGNRFATTTAIIGANVTLTGTTPSAWTFTSHTGNLDGETYDVDGIDDCSSVRWDDSSCLITQQTHYRWRNDDGGLGVHSSEWYNTDWDARKRVRIDNPNSTTTPNAVVEIEVIYDSDMQADFDDLRFTSADGVTLLNHWVGSTTASALAEVWVEVPSLTAESVTDIFMYYNNPAATSSSSMENTFIAADDFEDGDISEYSGQTSLFTVGSTFSWDGSYGLDNSGAPGDKADAGGILRSDQTITRGETLRFMQYIDTGDGSGDETCVLFATQAAFSNYAVCLEQFSVDRVSLVKDAEYNDLSGTVLASSTVTYTTGWYEVEVEWNSDNTFDVTVVDPSGSVATSFSGSDGGSPYTSGGIGFTYWFHYGGWDSVSSRPTLETEPSILFGAEQTDGGASWKAALDTDATYDVGDVGRLRIAIENSGLAITGQQMRLEYAAQGVAPSCEAVDAGEYNPVPVQASCGSSPVCMIGSANIVNGASTVDLLLGTEGQFTAGEAREDPSNTTGNIDIGQNEYTEVEYALTPTVNVADENLCFRVTDSGSDYDTYLSVGKMSLRFDPVLGTPTLNGGQTISLLPGTTTTVFATTTVTDLNGPGDLDAATTTFYRGGVGAACTPDNNNCYISSGAACSFTNCVGSTCDLVCSSDIYFHAEATDIGSDYDGEEWFAFMEVNDASGGYDFDTSIGQELGTLRAIDVAGPITYAATEAGSNTAGLNASTTIDNLGNVEINIEVQGTALTDGFGSNIPANQQRFATSTFTYGSCPSCQTLSDSVWVSLDVDLSKPVIDTPFVQDDVYWGIAVPLGTNSAAHQGINVFTPISP